ncbi:hypothetical protein DFJ63DRAFT_220870 [Scheffersomyces coipomensis]|uniref:uncharacterized protein n=1 Tax=Scheffersomyces coipomensis TaxID=1788519 RepID=UPI00315C7802
MRITSNLFTVLCTFLITQLSCSFALTHRYFRMSYLNNGACVLINSTTPDTSLRFNFYGVKDFTVPVVIFEYSEILYFKNVPNLNYFVNHTYIYNDEWHLMKYSKSGLDFLIEPRKPDLGLPPSYFNNTIDQNGSFQYKIPRDGVYCIYFPVYTAGPQNYLPGRYVADVIVVDETYPLNVFSDISIHVSLSILYGIVFAFISFFHPAIAKGQLSKLPIITRSIAYVLIVSFLYSSIFFILEIICAYYPTDRLYEFTEETYYNFQRGLIGKLPNYVSVLVYLGYGFSNLDFKPYIKITTFVFVVHILASLYGDYVVGNVSSLVDISFLGDKFSILYKTVILYGNYRDAYLGFKSDLDKKVLMYSSYAQIGTEILIFIICSVHAIIIYFKLRKAHRKAANKMLISFFIHLLLYKLAVKQILVFLNRIIFNGVFDVGESLKVFGNIIEGRDLKLYLIDLIELVLIWALWGTNRLVDVRKDTVKSDKKAAVAEKSAAEAKKLLKGSAKKRTKSDSKKQR